MVEEKGAPPRVKTVNAKFDFYRFYREDAPAWKNGICFSIFTVFAADMLVKKGRPPVKDGKTTTIRFLPFYSGYGRRKRVAPPGKDDKKEQFRSLPFFTARMPRGNPVTRATPLNQHSCLTDTL